MVSDLSSFVSPQATVVANEAGNSIVITDTQSNIRHLVEIIKAVDNSAEAETEIRVFRLKYASPTDVASELSSIFPSSKFIRQPGANPVRRPVAADLAAVRRRIRRWRRQSVRGPSGGGGTANNSSQHRIQKATQVTAVADSRIQAVIVTAPKDLMERNRRHDGGIGRAFGPRPGRLCYPDEQRRSAAGGAGVAKHVPQQQHFAQRHEQFVAKQRAPATRSKTARPPWARPPPPAESAAPVTAAAAVAADGQF